VTGGWTALALVILLLLTSSPCFAGWTITLPQRDITALAAPEERAGVLTVDAVTIALPLGLHVQSIAQGIVVDVSGAEWRAQVGGGAMTSGAQTLTLRVPLYLRGRDPYLPLDVLAEMAGMQLEVNRERHHVGLSPAHARTPNPPGGNGDWESFDLEKTPAEKALLEREQHASLSGKSENRPAVLPPTHESLRFNVGVGYVQGADFGVDLSGYGRAAGQDVQLNGLLTGGRQGLRINGGRLVLRNGDSGSEAAFGNVQSDIWGFANGATFTRRIGADHFQSLAFYLPGNRYQNRNPVLAVRDERSIGKHLRVGGEAATDGSFLLKARWNSRPWSLDTYYRSTSERTLDGLGAYIGYEFGRGWDVHGSFTQSGTAAQRSHDISVGMTIPLRRGVQMTLEHTQGRTTGTQTMLDAVTLALPVGPINVITRYQHGTMYRSLFAGVGWLASPPRQDLSFSLGYGRASRVNFNYQAGLHWQQNGSAVTSGQLVTSLRLSRLTQLQLYTAFPQALDPNQFHLRLEHQLRRDLSVSIEYGLLTPYQTGSLRTAERGLMLMARTHVDVATPAVGGVVRGKVVDLVGNPVPGVAVTMDRYRAISDRAGDYVFQNVPAGHYTIELERESLPADYGSNQKAGRLDLTARSRSTVDFQVIPLRTISGHVFWDKESGAPGKTVGAQGIVIVLDDFATISAADGSFAFFNVEPGKHRLKIDVVRLPTRTTPVGPAEIAAELPPDRSIASLVFVVAKRDKETEFQTSP
jgi:hypothetical protein